jgi:hypothetical protein
MQNSLSRFLSGHCAYSSSSLSLLFMILFSLFTQSCAGRPEDAMSKPVSIAFDVLDLQVDLEYGEADHQWVLPMDFETGPQGYWIRSSEALKKIGYRAIANSAQSNKAPQSAPDWSKQDLFMVTLGVQGTTGHTMKIEKVETLGDTLRIYAVHVEPTGMVGEALTHPKAMLVLPKWKSAGTAELWIGGKLSDCQWHIVE